VKYITGLDWSGDPGNPVLTPSRSPLLTYASVHAPIEEIECVKIALREARRKLRLPEDFPFKHSGSSLKTRQIFFAAVNRTPVFCTALVIDKRDWVFSHDAKVSGEERICDGIVELVCGMPDELIAGQLLLIDKPRGELKLVKNYRTAVRKALRGSNRESFDDVRPRPDDRDESATVQIADMIAGELTDHGGVGGPYLSVIAKRITILRAQ
jgi:hypothetical protein